MRRRLAGLYIVASSGTPLEKVEAALRGGADLIQIWSPSRTEAELEWARRVRERARVYGVPLLVNNDLELATKVGADGLHIDGDRPLPAEVRHALGSEGIVGYTCGTEIEKVLWAARVGADYISFCAIFPSPSVRECPIVPLALVREAKQRVRIPVFASGGITLANAQRVLEAGADGLAVISAVFQAPVPEEAARQFKSLMKQIQSTVKSSTSA